MTEKQSPHPDQPEHTFDPERALPLVQKNCDDVREVLRIKDHPVEQWETITTLLMHMGVLRSELFAILRNLAQKHPDRIPENQRHMWLKDKK